ncbi:MAG TPA: lantibiotic dehydratase [Pyrinomonadaceae bacterium]|jgi:hypothetical protein
MTEPASVSAQRRTEPERPAHLVFLPCGEWAFWRCIGLRGAGFPAAQVLHLAAPLCASAADQLVEAEDEQERALEIAREALRREMLKAGEDARAPFQRALRQLGKGVSLKPFAVGEGAAPALNALEAARASAGHARAAYQSAFQTAASDISKVIREIASAERFREAVTWQNRRALGGSIDALLRMSDDSTRLSERQRREELVANYLQRYCVKNDSIGFFGPVGWASFADQSETIIVRPGAELLKKREVYFEGWGIDALAEKLAQDRALRPWIAPRRMPFVRLEGTTLYMMLGRPSRLSAEQALVLQACDGERLAKEIALDLISRRAAGLKTEADVYGVLDYLKQRGLISWTFEIPVKLHPERRLRQLLERVEEEGLRASALEALGELENGRRAVARAAGDAAGLDQSLDELERTFVRLTGVACTRSAGEMYASRTLVYEDCRRDVEVKIGPEILSALGRAITPLLTSARWFTYQLADLYRKAFQELYQELSLKRKSSIIDFSVFWLDAVNLLFAPQRRPEQTILALFQKQWSEILALPAGRRCVRYASEELGPSVNAAFDAPHAGWSGARYHSPDVMISAQSIDAITRGEYELVLGELHVGMNTLVNTFFLSQHPSPDELLRSCDRDLAHARVIPVAPKNWPGLTTRTSLPFNSTKDFYLEISGDNYSNVKSRALPISSLVVEQLPEHLSVRSRDAQLSFDIIDVFGEVLSQLAVNCAKILAPAPYSPRIAFDRLTVCRETWQFRPREMPFAFEKERARRFVTARRWAREHDLPRFVFVKAPVEVKPFYVDFDSPVYVDLFDRVVRRSLASGSPSQLISVSEMLPTHDRMWLPDDEGLRYSSELRVVALDLIIGPP